MRQERARFAVPSRAVADIKVESAKDAAATDELAASQAVDAGVESVLRLIPNSDIVTH